MLNGFGTTVLQSGGGGGGMILLVVYLAVVILSIAGTWKTFTKAGKPGWGAIVPIYNVYLMLKIGGNPGWYLILLIIPIANIVIAAKMMIDIAKSFGKGVGFGIGLWILGFIFFPLLGFGDAQYRGPPQ